MCNLKTPLLETWMEDCDEIGNWTVIEYDGSLRDPNYKNFARYLRDKWTPSAVPSSMFCNALGLCSIGSCLNLVPDDGTNQHDRQMALYVFEQVANIDYLFKAVDKQLHNAVSNIGMAIGTALALAVSVGFGFLPAIAAVPGAIISSVTATTIAASANAVASTYVGVVTTLNVICVGPDFVDDLKDLFKDDLAYIVLAENRGGCENERTKWVRGPHEYLVCLLEHPGLGFWLYSIDWAKEDDDWHDDQAHVRGPTGFWRLDGDSKYYGITLENIARSSLWAYETDLVEKKGKKIDVDLIGIDPSARLSSDKDRMRGVFTVPICFNPGGESISGVLDEKGQNYPCICGPSNWNGKNYSPARDQTVKFLLQTGFAYSEDWEDWCSGKNDCKTEDRIWIRGKLEKYREPGDPPVPKHLNHPYRTCEKRRNSKKHPGWPDRDRSGNTKRNQLDWAIYDESRRNGTREAFGFES
ncbi:hypothetical protein OPT61_g5574 [Boeremia exigua]|uniref:Uncharacterized protein n=1 Tax=Boeremia exigua TaxID=749465 RepID=A0ACC2I9S2_9PLEO|nr:hypothetical protein OPT61_g5574 [Boeremia exigua]